MPVFRYKARVNPQTMTNGTLVADSERAAVQKLRARDYHPLVVRPAVDTNVLTGYRQRVGKRDQYLFLRRLADLLSAGLPPVSVFTHISEQTGTRYLAAVAAGMKELLQTGAAFSEAMQQYPRLFTALDISMVRAAESTGTLSDTLANIADLKERELLFGQRIRGALAYPALLTIVGAVMLFVLGVYVLPKFVELFADLDQSLPLLTQALVAGSGFLGQYGVGLIAGVVAAAAVAVRVAATARGRRFIDRALVSLWYVGPVVRRIHLARFAQSLGTLLKHGVPMLAGLNICAGLIGNDSFAAALRKTRDSVAAGQALSAALREFVIFDKNTVELIAVGEESGKLDTMLFRIAALNEQESMRQLDTALLLIEPLLIIFFGGVVTLIVIAVLLPILQMNFLTL